MPVQSERFDAESVREEWDAAARAYAEAQATGRDFYRLELFGPVQIELCGEVRSRTVLDVGSGTGYFAREMAQRGAQVTGIDISPKMVAHAVEHETRDPLGIRYVTGDAARLSEYLGSDRFDLVTSCLALQDMPDIQKVLRAIHDALVVGGRLVASIAHPCTDTPFRRWAKDESGTKQWLCIDRYFERGPIKYKWKGWAYEFSTSAQHATLEDWFAWFRDAGFSLRDLREPRPTDTAILKYPELEDAARIPYFLLLDLERTS